MVVVVIGGGGGLMGFGEIPKNNLAYVLASLQLCSTVNKVLIMMFR